MFRNPVFLAVLASLLIGCSDRQDAKRPTLTNNDLLKLMEGELFEVRIPEDIDPDQYAGIAIRRSDGSIETLGSTNKWGPGELVKVVCFSPEKGALRYSWIREGGVGSGSISDFPITQKISPNPKRTELEVGDRLIRYSPDNQIVIAGELEGDDFEVIFHISSAKDGN